jgi:cell wall-associated NlpC family hydrolase
VAIAFARRVRPLIALVSLGAAALVAPTLASATPHRHHAPRTATSVQKQLGHLALENSQLVEKYNQAQVAVQRRVKAAKQARLDAALAREAYGQAHREFAQIVKAQYESGGSFGAASALLDSSSGSNYLARLDTLDMVTTHNAQVVGAVSDARDEAVNAANRAADLLAAARQQRADLVTKRKQVEAKIRKYQLLLATLNSAQQYAYLEAANPAVSQARIANLKLVGAPSAAAQKAVEFALSQVGKPYVWGAAGPFSYDCSGLTMASWAHGGVSLPHSAADQYNYGKHVPLSALRPGDLIFFYSPIGHVTIYIGNGLMVSAPTEGQDVSVVPLSAFNGEITGATRLTP